MTVIEIVQNIMRRIFNMPDLLVQTELTADQIGSWDSLTHVQLIIEIEREFNIRFKTQEIASLTNVGHLIEQINFKRKLRG